MIIVCGEALVDLFVGRPTPDGIPTEAVAGGSPYNVALGLGRLGSRVGFLSTIADDAFGDFLTLRLAEAGVDMRFVRRIPSSTTLSVVATSATGEPHYTFHAEAGADRALSAADLPDLPQEVRCIAAGSYALAVEPIASAIETLVGREAGRRVVSIDPNIRARVIGDVAAFRPRLEALLAQATIVKASVEDLQLLYGGADPGEVAGTWLAQGAALVVVTRGGEGTVAYFGGGQVERGARPVSVVDTVGAGDSFHAALLAQLDSMDRLNPAALQHLGEDEIGAALDFAIAASALTCTRRGANLPARADVESFLARTR
jgi:fructokinase